MENYLATIDDKVIDFDDFARGFYDKALAKAQDLGLKYVSFKAFSDFSTDKSFWNGIPEAMALKIIVQNKNKIKFCENAIDEPVRAVRWALYDWGREHETEFSLRFHPLRGSFSDALATLPKNYWDARLFSLFFIVFSLILSLLVVFTAQSVSFDLGLFLCSLNCFVSWCMCDLFGKSWNYAFAANTRIGLSICRGLLYSGLLSLGSAITVHFLL